MSNFPSFIPAPEPAGAVLGCLAQHADAAGLHFDSAQGRALHLDPGLMFAGAGKISALRSHVRWDAPRKQSRY
jgi:hypothetical protein